MNHIGDGLFNIDNLMKDLNERYDVDLSKNIIKIDKRLTVEQLRDIHNLSSVHVTTTSGEGWGLVPCESSLCGIPQIVPSNTSHWEVFGESALICDTREECHNTSHGDINKPNNSPLIVYLTSHQYYCESYEYTDTSIPFIDNAITYYISSAGDDDVRENPNMHIKQTPINQHFKSLTQCKNYLKSLSITGSLPTIYQIVLSCESSMQMLVDNLDWFDQIGEQFEDYNDCRIIRKTKQVRNQRIIESTDKYIIKVDIPILDSVVDNLIKIYNDPNLQRQYGK
jgi:hypothetical protein